MTSKLLQKARDYEVLQEKKIEKEMRPAFHLTPRVGWMNDPNGFSFYDGKYHMFYQYHPYDTVWGPMHWGHAVSEDMLRWEYVSVSIAPDESYDKDGCFSGSAIELSDGRHLLMYTGVLREMQENGELQDVQTQCLAVGDGVNYEKCPQNPVLTAKDLPEGGSKVDFRDPKVGRWEDGTYYCVVGNRPADGSGQILLYTSKDGFDWKFEKVLIANQNRLGKMWECPDFFELDGKYVLLTSPQDIMATEDLEYDNGNGTLAVIGTFDKDTYEFKEEAWQSIDYGMDFYAPQTIKTEDGRRVMIGWMQNWDTLQYRTENPLWYGQMTIPREIFIKDGRLYQMPAKELKVFRSNQVEYHDVEVAGTVELDDISGRKVDIELEISPEEMYRNFEVRFAQNDKFYTSVSFKPQDGILEVSRKYSGTCRAYMHERKCKVNSESGKIKLRIVLDRFSAEIFANDGEQAMTITMYTEQDADKISFVSDGKVKMDITKYDILMEE